MAREDHSQSEWPNTPTTCLYEQPVRRKTKQSPKAKLKLIKKPSPALPRPRQSASYYEPDRKPVSAKNVIREMMIEDWATPLADVEAELARLGLKVSRVTTSNIRQETRELLRLLDRLGWLRSRPRDR